MDHSLANRLGNDVIEFAAHTSAHGIPRAYVANGCRRFLWMGLFSACFATFLYQAYLIIVRFNRNDIIVNVEIKYKDIAFPSVTVCNLNPYKTSKALEFGGVKDTLESLNKAMKAKNLESPRLRRALGESPINLSIHSLIPQAASVYCSRISTNATDYEPRVNGDEKCICASFPTNFLYWKCRLEEKWSSELCEWKNESLLVGNTHTNLHPCFCLDGFCIQDSQVAEIIPTEPLPISTRKCKYSSNETCLCVGSSSQRIEISSMYCAPFANWSMHTCGLCDWSGRCSKSLSLSDGDTQCLCHQNRCFQIESQEKLESVHEKETTKRSIRIRRHNRRIYEKILANYDGLLAVYTSCDRQGNEWKALMEKDSNRSTCLCFYNKKNGIVWPCYLPVDWKEKKCTSCVTFGNCDYSDDPKAAFDCLCAMPIKLCVKIEPPNGNTTALVERVVPYWEILPTTTISPIQKKKEETERAYNYVASDPVALNTQAKENVIFVLDKLTPLERSQISYTKFEFITRCSFNGRDCNISHDFSHYLDPIYGTCFTFNHDPRQSNLTSERAGPNYGLRFQVFVNIEEYMPTTEAAGVRLTVHSSDEQPFPDTLGYSAPTGFVSSFGIRMKHISRLPSPYGDCVKNGKDENFIYTTKEYSTEGCQRSCVQQHFVKKCGCGDPRYPRWNHSHSCPVDDELKRKCLHRETEYAAKNIEKLKCKKCRQPCSQQVFSISYSASRWPATLANRNDCPKGLNEQQCLNYLREQGAMIEVFFEQLNYEALQESEAYGWINLLSDFGGQLGLWMGVSVITISEVGLLVLDIVFSLFGFKRKSNGRSQMPHNRSPSSASLKRAFTHQTVPQKTTKYTNGTTLLEKQVPAVHSMFTTDFPQDN
ncbi:unnamed protein product, partial [Mesorhabditis belari]|uniref:Uncharacterized protein n=1 Tax=Mesorhabditis belari TaxID=2138241 RepID=A0AAF3J2B8_9BILA